MTTFRLSSLRTVFVTLCALFLVSCQAVNTQGIGPRAIGLLAVVENQSECAIPLKKTREVFSAAGFSSTQERIDLIWNLRTQIGALSVYNFRLEANTEKCGRPQTYLVADEAKFRYVQDFFLGLDCIVSPKEIATPFNTSNFSQYEFGTYVQILLAAGALEIDGENLARKDWNGCASV